jgi:hypothetical protein
MPPARPVHGLGAQDRPFERRLRLRADRPPADPDEVEDRELQDQHHEDQLDHDGEV